MNSKKLRNTNIKEACASLKDLLKALEVAPETKEPEPMDQPPRETLKRLQEQIKSLS